MQKWDKKNFQNFSRGGGANFFFKKLFFADSCKNRIKKISKKFLRGRGIFFFKILFFPNSCKYLVLFQF